MVGLSLPPGWRLELLGDLGQLLSGGTPTTSNEAYWNGDIPWVSAKDMKRARLSDAIDHVSDRALGRGTRLAPKHALLLVVRGMSLARSFPVARAEVELAFNQDLKALVPRADVDSDFLLWWLTAHESLFMGITTESTHGTKRLPTGAIRAVEVALPHETEQRAIATALSDVDSLLGALDRLIAKKRNLKQAAMQQLLTGQTRLPGFSGEWDIVEFGSVATIRNAKLISSSALLGTSCVELDGIESETGRLLRTTPALGGSAKYSFKAGDVLFGRLRAYLRKFWMATFDGLCSTEIWPLIPSDRRLCGPFLHLVVQTEAFVKAAAVAYGTHMPRSDWSVLAKMRVGLPAPTEQIAIASALSDMDAEIEALEARRAKTRDIKQAMMQELLTGRTRLI